MVIAYPQLFQWHQNYDVIVAIYVKISSKMFSNSVAVGKHIIFNRASLLWHCKYADSLLRYKYPTFPVMLK